MLLFLKRSIYVFFSLFVSVFLFFRSVTHRKNKKIVFLDLVLKSEKYMRNFLLVFFVILGSVGAFSQNTVNTTHPSHLYHKGIELVQLRQFSAAQEILNEYLAVSDDLLKQVDVEYYLALCALELTQPTAEGLFIKFVQSHPHHPKAKLAYYELGNFYFDKKDYKKAITYLEQRDPHSLNDEQLLKSDFNLAYSYFLTKNYDKALEGFNKVKIESQENKYQYVAYYYAGYIQYKKQNYSDALDDLQEAEKNDTYKKIVPYLIVSVYNRLNETEKLIKYAEAKLAEDVKYSSEASIRLLLGEAYYKKQEYEKALPHFEAFVKKKGKGDKQVVYRLGHCYYYQGMNDKAEEYFKSVASLDNAIGQSASYYLGHIYLGLDNKEFALSALSQASTLDHDKPLQKQALLDVSKLCYELEKFDVAIISLKMLNKSYPTHTYKEEVRELLSQCYLNTNNYEEAIGYIDNLKYPTTSIKKVYQEVTFRRGVELYNKKKFKEALPYFEKSVREGFVNEQKKLDQDLLIQTYFWKGEIHSILRNWEGAKKDYQRVFSLTNRKKSIYRLKARYGMGYAYFNTRNFGKAKTEFVKYTGNLEKAKDRMHYGNALLRVGDCYFLLKDFKRALTAYEKAIKEETTDIAYAYLKKAEVLGYLQELDKAYKAFDIVITQFSNSPYRTEATYQKAVLSLNNADFRSAVKNFTYFLVNEPNSEYLIECYLKRGIAYQNLKDYELALADFDKILKEFCRDSIASQALIASRQVLVADNKLKDYEQRMNDYYTCNPDDPTRVDKLYELGRSLYRSRKYAEAIKSFENLLTDFPDNNYKKEVTNLTANAYYMSKEYDKAIPYFKEVEKSGSKRDYVKALEKLSKIYVSKNDHESIKYYNLKLLPLATNRRKQVKASTNLMNSYYALEKYDSSLVYANDIVDKGSPVTTALYNASLMIGKIDYEQKRTEKALDEFIALMNKATAHESGAEANYYVGKILFEQGKKTQALESLSNLTKNYESFEVWVGQAFLLIADIYIDMEEYFQARATLSSLINYFPLPEVKKEAEEKLKIVDEKEKIEVVEEETVEIDVESGEIVTEIKKDTINTDDQTITEEGGTENE